MPSHQDRVRQNYCEHQINLGLCYWFEGKFVANCIKCGKRIQLKANSTIKYIGNIEEPEGY